MQPYPVQLQNSAYKGEMLPNALNILNCDSLKTTSAQQKSPFPLENVVCRCPEDPSQGKVKRGVSLLVNPNGHRVSIATSRSASGRAPSLCLHGLFTQQRPSPCSSQQRRGERPRWGSSSRRRKPPHRQRPRRGRQRPSPDRFTFPSRHHPRPNTFEVRSRLIPPRPAASAEARCRCPSSGSPGSSRRALGRPPPACSAGA